MKKLIALLLALVMVLGLAACGGEEPKQDGGKETTVQTEDDKETTNDSEENRETEPTQPSETEPAVTQTYGLQFSAADHPVIPALEWLPQGEYTVATTPFEFDLEKLCTQLQTIPYFQEHFSDLTNTREETYESEDDAKRSLRISDTIELTDGAERNIKFVFYRNAATYSSYNTVYLYTYGTDLTAELQNALCEVCENAGLPMMKYVLTAQDPDGKTCYGDEFSDWQAADSMGEKVIAEDGVEYTLKRDINSDLTTLSCSMDIGYHSGWNVNYADGCVTSILETAPYRFEDLVSAEFGASNPLDAASFGDQLFKSCFADYQQSSIPLLNATRVQYMNGAVKYSFSMELTYVSTDDSADPISIKYGVTYMEKDGQIYDVDAGINTYEFKQTRNGTSQEVMYNEALKIVQAMIGGADVSNFSYEDTRSMSDRTIWRNDISAVIFGQEVTIPDVMLVYDGEEMDISVNLGLLTSMGSLG